MLCSHPPLVGLRPPPQPHLPETSLVGVYSNGVKLVFGFQLILQSVTCLLHCQIMQWHLLRIDFHRDFCTVAFECCIIYSLICSVSTCRNQIWQQCAPLYSEGLPVLLGDDPSDFYNTCFVSSNRSILKEHNSYGEIWFVFASLSQWEWDKKKINK